MFRTVLIIVISFISIDCAIAQRGIDIGSRRELFIDNYLIDTLSNLTLRLHTPQLVENANVPNGHYQTVLKDDGGYRFYYRGVIEGYKGPVDDGNMGEVTKSAISTDGIHWDSAEIGEIDSLTDAVFHAPPFNHNFTPFLDTNPLSKEKYKALSGTKKTGGLYYYYSKDGKRFYQKYRYPVIKADTAFGEFDSQNVAFWSEYEQQYVCYYRRVVNRLRSVVRVSSKDFVHWTKPIKLFPNLENEHLYTTGTHPYFRAPHIYIALATRFFPSNGNSTDIVFMTAWDSTKFDRTFKQAFIQPGLDQRDWGNRSNYIAYNVVPLSENEMGIYGRGKLYKLRKDGFASVHSDYEPGQLKTKPITFTGPQLEINYSTSAGGYVKVSICGISRKKMDRFSSEKIVGDELSRIVTWSGGNDLSAIEGMTVRLLIELKEADLYSIKFRD